MELWDVPLLVKAGLLKPLGHTGAKNRVKFFASVVVEDCARDPKWLHRATDAISRCRPDGTTRTALSPKPTTAKSVRQQSVAASSLVRPATSTAGVGEHIHTLTKTISAQEDRE